MKKIFLVIFILTSIGMAGLNVGALVEQGAQYDKKSVEIQGEVIGDIMYRNDRVVWLNVLTADGNAIGVLCSPEQVKSIKFTGSYKFKGDIVLVRGIFYRFSQTHSGETMIAAKNIDFISAGYPVKHILPKSKLGFTIVVWLLIVLFSIKPTVRSLKYILLKLNRGIRHYLNPKPG